MDAKVRHTELTTDPDSGVEISPPLLLSRTRVRVIPTGIMSNVMRGHWASAIAIALSMILEPPDPVSSIEDYSILRRAGEATALVGAVMWSPLQLARASFKLPRLL